MKTVTFCGHSSLQHSNYEQIRKQLYGVLDELIQKGARDFLIGGSGEFDRMCAIAVGFFKMKNPHISCILVTPKVCRDYDKDLYDRNEHPALGRVPKKYLISKRNEYMADRADVVIAYVTHSIGDSHKMLAYAESRNKRIIHLSDSYIDILPANC